MYFSEDHLNSNNIKTKLQKKCAPRPTKSETQIQNSISCMAWNSLQTMNCPLLATTNWLGELKIYQLNVQSNLNISFQNKASQKICDSSLLKCCWDNQDTLLYYGDSEGKIFSFDVTAKKSQVYGIHEQSISSLNFLKDYKLLVSTSYSNDIKLWDRRMQSPALSLQLPEKVFCGATNKDYIGLGVANDKVVLMDVRMNMGTYYQQNISPFKNNSQIQSINLHPNKNLLIAGSFDGRVAVCNILEDEQTSGYFNKEEINVFDLHFLEVKDETANGMVKIYYPVNCVGFSPSNQNWMYSASSNRRMTFFNFKEFKKIKSNILDAPVTACSLTLDGGCIAYSMGNDWHTGQNQDWSTQIVVRLMTTSDYKKIN